MEQEHGSHRLVIERIYGEEEYPQAYRILVDRLWPRGMSKVKARLDQWSKLVAPSADLRTWFGHDPAKFEEFTHRYRTELAVNPAVEELVEEARQELSSHDVVLLYGAKDSEHNQAVVLKDYLDEALTAAGR